MKNYYFMYYKPNLLVPIIIVLGSAISAFLAFAIELINIKTPFEYYQYPTATVIVGFLLFLITEKWWKYKPFSLIFISADISGRYEGKITFVHPITLQTSEKIAVMEIIQSGALIKIRSFFQKENGTEYTISESDVETIKKLEDGSLELHFTYRNKGLQSKLTEHCGTNILRFYKNQEGQFMEGLYYTNREPQTKGEIRLKFESKTLKHTI